MSFSVVTVKFSNEKTCFVSLSTGIFKGNDKTDIQVFEVEDYNGGNKCYVSWSGEVIRSEPGSDGAMLINGMYGAKLGLKDNDQIILRPCTSVKKCSRVSVEPLSVDDWEILDRHTGFFESHVMDQIRVVQKGRVFPVWVEKSICVYINVVSTSPDTDCVLLVNETEVLVAPKVRNSAIGQLVSEEPIRKVVTNDLNVPFLSNAATQSSEEETFDTKFNSTDSDYSLKDIRYLDSSRDDRNRREKSPYNFSNISSQWQGLFSLLGFGRTRLASKVDVSDGEEDYFDEDEEDSFHQSKILLQNGLNLILRVQYLKHTIRDGDHDYTEPVCRRGSNHSRKSGSSSPRKGSRESPSKVRNQSNPKSNFRINYFPQQPSTIYIDKFDACRQLKCNRKDVPPVFFAKLRKLASPREQQQEKLNQSTQSAKLGQSLGSSIGSSSGKGSPRKTSKDKPSPDLSDSQKSDSNLSIDNDNSGSCFVRVIVLDRRRHLCNDHYRDVMKRVLDEQPLLSGHVIVPDMLRRYLKLDISSRLWLQTYKATPSRTMAFSLHPLGNAPKVTHDMMCLAFRQWLNQISSEEYPLVVYQGLFLRFPTSPDQFVECQLTYNEPNTGNKCCHTLLHPGTLRSASLTVISQNRSTDLTHPAIQPMLAYNSLTSFDPVVPKVDFKMIGGMSDLLEKILCNVEICLGSRPLYKEVFLTTPGLLNGMLLLTGPKGSGKTTLAKAVCRKVSELPNLAHTTIVECKPLRGKKVDTLQKILELLFDEAAWHQPSLIVLEDLDHIAGAPAGPEFEMSGEALYAARVAEVVKDLLRKDIRNMSNLAVIATSQSRSSLHSILVSSRGTHLVQEVITINPPDRDQRKEIITTLLETKTTISQSALSSLDVDKLAQQTQGYVARDLESIINRAVHAHILTQGRAVQSDSELDLCENDFMVALNGFTPASIRNVPLHEAGGLGWQDIGGLTEVKETLVETLQWPSKYPTLFANCPLRLRSGLLLYGAPGTGKTLLAGVVAKECGLNFISIKGPELLSKYIGASEQAVRDTFVRAQSAKPCILFFDEFDSIAPRRGHDNTGVTDRVVNQLLTQLDGVEGLEGVYVLAATSRPDLIDPALLRPGRLDKSLLCTMPNEDDRLKILKALSRKMYLSSDVDFQHFARVCQDYTGADFKALLYNAQLEAIHEFTSQDSTTSEGDVGKFGMKARRGRYNKLKTPSKTKLLRVDSDGKTERRQSFSSGTHAYIPSLEEGVVQVSAEMEERLNTQISQIRLRDRRQSEHIAAEELPESPYGTSKLLLVNQSHMMAAANKMRPSVAGEERQKYERIYENFVSSRGGTFHTGFMEAQELMKATLA